ncbi:hypothetical protein OSB04_012265 [Centaurea solstitialis]|uniref:Uncharacterized protein n=1 Tax=Centaurea solstitialis TaxID=347529 RepID=A0AA38TLQ6_9ASTR|nr:hypothetical protein OSB04_012265 [Centaurea solstitialis]
MAVEKTVVVNDKVSVERSRRCLSDFCGYLLANQGSGSGVDKGKGPMRGKRRRRFRWFWHRYSIEYLYITSNKYDQKRILEKLRGFSSGLYVTTIQNIESNLIIH